MFIDFGQYKIDKRTITFTHKYKHKRIDFVRQIASYLIDALEDKDVESFPKEVKTYLLHVMEEGNPGLDSRGEPFDVSVSGIRTSDDSDSSFFVRQNSSSFLKNNKERGSFIVQKAANFLQHLLAEEEFTGVTSVYEKLASDSSSATNAKQAAIGQLANPTIPSCYSAFVNRNTLDCGVVYAGSPENSFVVLFQDLNTPLKLMAFLKSPVNIEKNDAIRLILDWYVFGEESTKWPIVLTMNRNSIDVVHVSDALNEDEDVFKNLKKTVQNTTNPVLFYNEESRIVPWLENFFGTEKKREYFPIQPVLQNAIPNRNLQDLVNELNNDLRQSDLHSMFDDSNLSYTIQWFVLCTKVYAMTNHLQRDLVPARFRASVLDKKVETEKIWKLMYTLAPNSFLAVNAKKKNQYNQKLPTWISIINDSGFVLRL